MKKFIIPASVLLLPGVAFAAALRDVFNGLGRAVDTAAPVAVALGVLYFFWGLASYIFIPDDPEKREHSRNIMIWAVIALFLVIFVWGLARVLENTLGINPSETTTR